MMTSITTGEYHQLTQDNIEKNTRQPKPNNLYYVGIHFNSDCKNHIRFKDQREQRWKYYNSSDFCSVKQLVMHLVFSDNSFYKNLSDPNEINFSIDKYTLHRQAPSSIEIPSEVWENEIIRELLKLIDNANIKQQKLDHLLRSNTYASEFSKFCVNIAPSDLYNPCPCYSQRFITNQSESSLRDDDSCFVKWIKSFVRMIWEVTCICVLMVVQLLSLIIILYLCCIDCFKKNNDPESGIKFLDNLSLQHPDLDFDVIEEDIGIGIQKICDNLNNIHLKNTSLIASYHLGLETVHYPRQGSTDSKNEEEANYIILFSKKVDSI